MAKLGLNGFLVALFLLSASQTHARTVSLSLSTGNLQHVECSFGQDLDERDFMRIELKKEMVSRASSIDQFFARRDFIKAFEADLKERAQPLRQLGLNCGHPESSYQIRESSEAFFGVSGGASTTWLSSKLNCNAKQKSAGFMCHAFAICREQIVTTLSRGGEGVNDSDITFRDNENRILREKRRVYPKTAEQVIAELERIGAAGGCK